MRLCIADKHSRSQMSFFTTKQETGEKMYFYFSVERNVTKKSVKQYVDRRLLHICSQT